MPKIYPIGGVKGGVGKSFITASLGTLFANRGKKVVLIDLDLGASNLHTLLGIKNPQNGLDSFLDKTVKKLESVAFPTDTPNLFFINSLHCSMEIANLLYVQKLKIITAIRKLPFDYILLDLGPGTNFNTLDLFLTSNEGILVCTPEPTAIENSFRFIKTVHFRKLKQILKRHAFESAIKSTSINSNNSAFKPPDIIDNILKYYPDKEKILRKKLSDFKIRFIFNQFRQNLDSRLGDQFETICNRHFYSQFQFLGNVSYDWRVYDSVLSRKLYVNKYPYTQPSIDLKKIADKITNKRPSASLTSLKEFPE
ncbi:MAG: AAA family ATPase [Deltaproteobacteria bacterium]|nr:AAA family ATPase [Deltaproteobacteria bacterium]